MPTIKIKSAAHYQEVAERIQALLGCTEGSKEERELIELVLAIEVWDTVRQWRT